MFDAPTEITTYLTTELNPTTSLINPPPLHLICEESLVQSERADRAKDI